MNSQSKRSEIEKAIRTRVLLTALCVPGVLVPLVFAVVFKVISGSAFALLALAFMVILVIVLTRMIRSGQAALKPYTAELNSPTEAERKAIRRRIRRLQFSVAFLFLALINGVVLERHAPLLPVLVGVTISLLFQVFFIQAILRLKKRLAAQPDPSAAANPPQPPA